MSATMLHRTSTRSLLSPKHIGSPLVLPTLSLRRFESTEAAAAPQPTRSRSKQDERVRLPRTHFLTLSLNENAELRAKVENFRERLLQCDPPIPGLSPEIVVPKLAQMLEIKLGNLNIKGYPSVEWAQRRTPAGVEPENESGKPAVELGQIMDLLQGLKDPIQKILTADGGNGVLRLPFGRLRPLLFGLRERFNPKKVSVLFLEPTNGSATEPLQSINQLVFETFSKAGLWVDTPRASATTMTLINTRYSPVKQRHFDLEQLYKSAAFQAVQKGESLGPPTVDWAEPRPVDFGSAVVSGLCLTRLGAGEGDVDTEGKLELPIA